LYFRCCSGYDYDFNLLGPYGKNRHYTYHNHKGHRYAYQGHWRSWDQWDRYAKAHPDIYRHGGCYREDAHLMFRFRDPVTGGDFFFFIGMLKPRSYPLDG
jgi:hypothetical protein